MFGISGCTLIGGDIYARIARYQTAVGVLKNCFRSGYINSRLVDPFSVHVSVPMGVPDHLLIEYFSSYGQVTNVSTKHKNFAFVSFATIGPAFRALWMSDLLLVRARVLSTFEPTYPKPWSPARMTF
jgi:hypothetical protein